MKISETMSPPLSLEKPRVYVFIGPEKTGTTTIFDLLPFARVPVQKEMFLLSQKNDVEGEIARIENQLATQEAAFIVEPTYFVSAFARCAFARLSGRYDLKIIHTRRDPVERMISHYLHHKAKGRVLEPEAAVATFPEIVEASRYEAHSTLWQATVPAFSVIDLASRADLAAELTELGISPRLGIEAIRSNQRLAPRSAEFARVTSSLWQGLIAIGFNRLVPPRLRNILKKWIYYGGTPLEATEEERACLIRLFSTTD